LSFKTNNFTAINYIIIKRFIVYNIYIFIKEIRDITKKHETVVISEQHDRK